MTKYDIGVVVGRFQVPELHVGHKKLLEFVSSEAKNVLVFLGVAPTLGTKVDPLDFTSRAKMIQTDFPNVIVVPLMDRPTNKEWSKNLDVMIRTVFPMGTVCLYGGKDSFLKQYDGSLKTCKIENFPDVSGTSIRKDAGKTIRNSSDFRAGIIYSTQNQYPRLHMTIDIAVVKGNKVLLGRKAVGGALVFPGGFVDPADESLEMAAVRELDEETTVSGLGADALHYVGSFQMNDWRYTKDERIITSFFVAKHTWGNPESTEELQDVAFYPINNATLKLVYESHKILWTALLQHLGKKDSKGRRDDLEGETFIDEGIQDKGDL
jgi:bifunctional NMN adenylyltransferase/nudix hydrolase